MDQFSKISEIDPPIGGFKDPRRTGHGFRWFVCSLAVFIVTGCTGTLLRVSNLPAEYAAVPVRDYSAVDVTRFAQHLDEQDRIQSGDRLEVRLNSGAWGEESEQAWTVGVDTAGLAVLPNVGPVRLAGLTRAEAEQAIVQTSLQRDVYRTPAVDVQLSERQMQTITVMGAVNQPGNVSVREPSVTLADVIVRAGGFTSEANGLINISGLPVSPQSSPAGSSSAGARTVNLTNTSEIELAGISVPSGAVVMVEKRQPREVQVIGVIANRTIQIPEGRNVRLLEALAMAGGPKYSNWILDKVYIIRQVPGSPETIRIKGSIRAAKKDASENLLLAPNDIVSVEENAMTFTLSTLSALLNVGTSGARLSAF